MSDDRQRIDRWLWNARVVRTRSAAAALVVAGHVRVNGMRVTAPGRDVKCGDVVTIGLRGGVRILKVTGMAPRRGDASAASQLYDELPAGVVQGASTQDPAAAPGGDVPPPRTRSRHGAENG